MFIGSYQDRVRFAVKGRIQGHCWVSYPGKRIGVHDCVVDTGASLTTIPQHMWSESVSVDWVRGLPKEAMILANGGTIEAREVMLPLMISGLEDDLPFDLGECRVWLAFDDDAGRRYKQALFGVGGGALAKGGLCINWKEQLAYFVEVVDEAASSSVVSR